MTGRFRRSLYVGKMTEYLSLEVFSVGILSNNLISWLIVRRLTHGIVRWRDYLRISLVKMCASSNFSIQPTAELGNNTLAPAVGQLRSPDLDPSDQL